MISKYINWANKLTTLYMAFGIQIGFMLRDISARHYSGALLTFSFALLLYGFIILRKRYPFSEGE